MDPEAAEESQQPKAFGGRTSSRWILAMGASVLLAGGASWTLLKPFVSGPPAKSAASEIQQAWSAHGHHHHAQLQTVTSSTGLAQPKQWSYDPKNCEPQTIIVPLRMTTCQVDVPGLGLITTRCYGDPQQGYLFGPTIRVRPGDTLIFDFKNELEPPTRACVLGETELPPPIENLTMSPKYVCEMNTTNLHTHGLHVSPLQDDITKKIEPGHRLYETVQIPADHLPGMAWYHPHFFGSTDLQAAGGAFGALIVDDPPGSLPSEVEKAEEVVMTMALVDIANNMRLESWGKGNLWQQRTNPYQESFQQTLPLAVLVNGQGLKTPPTLNFNSDKWYRLRMLYAALEMDLEVTEVMDPDNTAQCDYEMIGRDGYYIQTAPRKIPNSNSINQPWKDLSYYPGQPSTAFLYMSSGTRFDLLVSCKCPSGDRCKKTWRWKARQWLPASFWPLVVPNIPGANENTTIDATQAPFNNRLHSEGELLTIEVTNTGAAAPTLKSFQVNRPCYLADLQKVNMQDYPGHKKLFVLNDANDMGLGDFGVIWGPDGGMNVRYTGLPGQGPLNQKPMYVGNLYEVDLRGVLLHPMHLHVMPWQLQTVGVDTPLLRPGDYMDVMPTFQGDSTRMRFTTDKFTGAYIIHCHKLEHEDNGMMGFLGVEGPEGCVWEEATRYDPTCFREEDPNFGFSYL